jgi:hypothetical protein
VKVRERADTYLTLFFNALGTKVLIPVIFLEDVKDGVNEINTID